MKTYFDAVIKPRNDKLEALLDGEAKVNDLQSYTKDGITHVYVLDNDTAYELVDGSWKEQAPF